MCLWIARRHKKCIAHKIQFSVDDIRNILVYVEKNEFVMLICSVDLFSARWPMNDMSSSRGRHGMLISRLGFAWGHHRSRFSIRLNAASSFSSSCVCVWGFPRHFPTVSFHGCCHFYLPSKKAKMKKKKKSISLKRLGKQKPFPCRTGYCWRRSSVRLQTYPYSSSIRRNVIVSPITIASPAGVQDKKISGLLAH